MSLHVTDFTFIYLRRNSFKALILVIPNAVEWLLLYITITQVNSRLSNLSPSHITVEWAVRTEKLPMSLLWHILELTAAVDSKTFSYI
jgi:hypothetical protein